MTPQEKLIVKHWHLPTLDDIATKAGLSRAYVCNIGKKLGLPARKRGPQGPIGPVDPNYIVDVHHRLEAGETTTTVAAHWGVTRQAISQIATYYGFPVRKLRCQQNRRDAA